MSDPSQDLIGGYVGKAGAARSAMWSAMGNVFGFIISAASIISALSKPVWWLLLPILFLSFAGIMALLSCFQRMHSGYIDIVSDLAKIGRTEEEKLETGLKDIRRPDDIGRSERLAIILLWISAILFFAQALKSFF